MRISLILMAVLAIVVARIAIAQSLDINMASPAELASALPGIGPAKAKAIVSYRELHGPFEFPEALLDVKGIGPSTLKKITPLLEFGAKTMLSPDGLRLQRAEEEVRQKLQRLLHE